MRDWIGVKNPYQARAHQQNHDREADADTQHMGDTAPKSEIRTGRHQHQIIRPWRNRRHERKNSQSKQKVISHTGQYGTDLTAFCCVMVRD